MVSYDQLMTVIILKEISIMGKEVALKESRIVPGIKVDDQGNVTGGSKAKLKSLIDVFKELSGGMAIVFAKKAIEPILTGDEDLPEELAGKP